MKNPIKAKLEELEISTRAAGIILDMSHTSVHRHANGTRRLSADNIEIYHRRLGIPLEDLRRWNICLGEKMYGNDARLVCEDQDK